MIFRTLYSRLAFTLFILLSSVGLVLVQLIGHASSQYQQEVAQKLNYALAEHIVAEQELIVDQMVNYAASDTLFHNLMVINPSIELYFLDVNGSIMGFNAPEGKVKRDHVDLEPVRQFLSGGGRFPLKGDDPRSLSNRKVFSAAEIKNEQGLQGYLYIVLGSEQYDDVVHMLGSSYIIDSSIIVLIAAITAALVGGLIVFAFQTRRLSLLRNVMRRYADENTMQRSRQANDNDDEQLLYFPADGDGKDEIDELGVQFNAMADKINEQILELQRTDGMRREMVANISHDLRTPLTTMRGYLETLLLKAEDLSPEEQKEYLETALSHSQHLATLVEQLFELARLDSCEAIVYSEPFSMGELVQDVAESFRLRAEQKQIELNVSVSPGAPLIFGDIAMMQRVLENLLENAVRHTMAGGYIGISVDVDSANVVVRVEDSGCGIPAEDVPKIFDRFYQQDANRNSAGSSGLGLAIVKRILELHGSVIDVSSEVNRGTTFSFGMTIKPSL